MSTPFRGAALRAARGRRRVRRAAAARGAGGAARRRRCGARYRACTAPRAESTELSHLKSGSAARY